MGDIFFNLGSLPFVDVDSGGSLDGVINAVEQTLARIDSDTKVIPGHGPVTGKQALEAYRALLLKAKSTMVSAMSGGKSLEEVLAAKPLSVLNLTYSNWLPEERVTTLFYRSLSAPHHKH